jgi:hypothetical protein
LDRLRHELSAQGFDETLILVGGDAAGTPYASGLRVPYAPGFRYRLLVSVVDLAAGDFIMGLRQLVELWAFYGTGEEEPSPPLPPDPPYYVFKLLVSTPDWHFIDGFTTWTLTSEPLPPPSHRFNVQEQQSLAFEDSTTPALVFETVGFPGAPLLPGYIGLNAYTPPAMRGQVELCWRDLRFPWSENSMSSVRMRATGATRVRLYCDVLQTDPVNRYNPDVGPLNPQGFGLEDKFVTLDFPTSARYGVVNGSIIVGRQGGNV